MLRKIIITLTFLVVSISLAQNRKRPNIIVILADDMGFSDLGCYGGEIPTPNLDKLASDGLRFKQFYNTSRCCPTRASLLTGLYQHQAGIGQMTKTGKNPNVTEAYQGYLNKNCVTLAEVLKSANYHTYMAGKWHVGKEKNEHWPLQRGFEKYYGIIGGAANYFSPKGLMLNNTLLPRPTDKDYYTTDKFTDYALKFIDEQNDDNPFFLYLAFNAPHWPLNAKEEDINKLKGMYDEGWDIIRKRRWEKQIELGIIDSTLNLSPRTNTIRAWDNFTEKEQSDLSFRMTVYAAMVNRLDKNVGRLLKYLNKNSLLENTLIIFLSDNGGCPEPWGKLAYRGHSDLGGGKIENINNPTLGGSGGRDGLSGSSYGEGWANVSNTPFRRYKTESEEGGISTPCIVHWPKGIKVKKGSITNSVGHIIDLMATFVDVANAKYPTIYKNHFIYPMEGKSLRPIFETGTRVPHKWLFWEHNLEGAVRTGDWKAIFNEKEDKWSLFNVREDRTELNNLAAIEPEMLATLKRKWFEWAYTHQVLPKLKTNKNK